MTHQFAAEARPSDNATSVSVIVADRLDSLKPAERKVARALIADYPAAGLSSVASLAASAGVSAPTVVRFAAALGYSGFGELQSALKRELRVRTEGPLGTIAWDRTSGSVSDLMVQRARTMTQDIESSIMRIPPGELDQATKLLADSSRRLYLSGGRYSSILARHLANFLETIRPKVRYIDQPFSADLSALVALTSRDVYVMVDFHRYQRDTIELAREVRRRGATVILITDEKLSPAAGDAAVVLPVNVVAPSPFHTLGTGLILVELLALSVLQELGDKGRKYLASWETIRGRELVIAADDEPPSAAWTQNRVQFPITE